MKINLSKTKNFWAYIVLGALFVIASIILAPIWGKIWSECPWKDWGIQIIKFIIAFGIIFYLAYYLVKKVKRTKGTIQVLTIVEFVVLALIALGCILSRFVTIPLSEACQILGLVLWFEGVIDLFRAYFYRHGDSYKYPICRLCIAIFLVTFGTYLFVKPLFTNIVVLWIFIAVLLSLGIYLITLGCLKKPKGKKENKKKKKEKESE